MATNNNKPSHALRCGNIKATIWLNESEKGPFFATTFSRPLRLSHLQSVRLILVRVQKQMSENTELGSAVLFLVILVSTDLCAVESPESGNYIEVPPGTQKSPMQSV